MTDDVLDTILAIQFAVAWAGEGRCSPRRLGFWDTDLVDEAGGGDFFARLLPQTHAWASLEAVREAGRRVDARARAKMADPDKLRTIFFLGFELDEQLADRITQLKQGRKAPMDCLSFPIRLTDDFNKEAFSEAVHVPSVSFTVVPGGRQLKGSMPDGAVTMVRNVAGALVPLTDQYPLPFYKVEG